MSAAYRVAVRALCEFTAREGDLDHRFTPAPSAQEGIQGHTLVASDAVRIILQNCRCRAALQGLP